MTEEEKRELKFLRYFYDEASNGMGPASGDIYRMIKAEYQRRGHKLPKGYEDEE